MSKIDFYVLLENLIVISLWSIVIFRAMTNADLKPSKLGESIIIRR